MTIFLSRYFSCLLFFYFSINFFASTAIAVEPLKIGLSLGLSGKYSVMAAVQKNGFSLWAQDVNQRGGILDRPVQLVIKDDTSNPEMAKKLYQELITDDNVDFVFAPFSSEITEAILPLTAKHNYPLIASGAAADKIWNQGYRNVFGMFTPASKIAVSFLEFLVINNLDDIAIFYGSDPFSRTIAYGVVSWAKRFGLKILLVQQIDVSDANYKDQVPAARQAGAEVVMSCGQYQEAIAILQAFKDTEWHPRVFYTPVGPGLKVFHEMLGDKAEYTFSTSQWDYHGGVISPATKRFVEEYKENFEEEPSYFAATAYAAGQILEAAIRKVGSFERKKVIAALFKLNITSLIGKFGVDKAGMQIRNYNLVVQVQDGRNEIVWPELKMTAPPIIK